MIFDLDGTILSINSFRPWALFMLKARFTHLGTMQRLCVSVRALAILAARKLRVLDHDSCKWRLQRLWKRATAGDGGRTAEDFSRELMAYVRPEMREVLSWVAAGRVEAVMATAAAGDYAQHLGKMLGFSHVLATPQDRPPGIPENAGKHKLEAVTKLIIDRGWGARQRVLFTDHVDDLPLIGICENVFWFGSDHHGRRVADAAPNVKLHPCASRNGSRPQVPFLV